jgi:NitT/TauT family transport system ATP-binding protein
VSLVGPSGSGKSSLLRAVIGLQQPSMGTVEPEVERSQIGMLFQDDALLPWKSARENVALGLGFHGVEHAAALAQADDWLARLGLAGFEHRFPRHLSGGQRKRVALAQVLAMKPRLLLMDEPFASLDAQTREAMQEELLQIWTKAGKTVLFVTHQIDEAIFLSDRVVVFSARPGKVKDIITVGIERPRALGLKRDARFHAIEDRIWSLIDNDTDRSRHA